MQILTKHYITISYINQLIPVSVSDTEIVFHRRPAQDTIDEIQAKKALILR